MRFILKFFAATFALALAIVAASFSFVLSVSNVIFGIASSLVFFISVALFITGQPTGGAAFMGIAFLVSPFGLPALAGWLVRGLDDYAVLNEKTADVTSRFNALSARVKELDAALNANAELQKHIVTYSKTRQTYIEYRKAGYSKKFKALHEADIILHQTAKKHFDGLGLKKLPSIASLRASYAPMLEEKKKAYREYRQARTEMRELLLAKSNVDRLMGTADKQTERKNEREL